MKELQISKVIENIFSINKDLDWKELILLVFALKQGAWNFSSATLQVSAASARDITR